MQNSTYQRIVRVSKHVVEGNHLTQSNNLVAIPFRLQLFDTHSFLMPTLTEVCGSVLNDVLTHTKINND